MSTIAELSNLRGKRALITGAAGGIGRIVAETLAELGAELLLVDRPGTDYGSLISTIEAKWHVRARALECDLEQETHRDALIETVRQYDRLDVLVNNAAFVGASDLEGWSGPLEDQSLHTWGRALEVNLTAVFHLTKGTAALLQKHSDGCVINVASIYGSLGPDYTLYKGTSMGNPAAYAASKGGLIQLTRWLATTLAPKVRVNSISPGGVLRNQPEVFVERYAARTPLGRMANEDDFRGAVAFLSTGLSQYVTGHDLAVDGGWSVW